MLQNKPLTQAEATEIIAQLDAIADRLFLAGYNTQGNAAIEAAVAYVVKKNPSATAAKVTTTTVAKTEAVAE
jgi:hypothetical protein